MLVQFLQKTDLFEGLDEEAIRKEILPSGQIREIKKGEFLLLPNDRLDYFGIILSGEIHARHLFPDGNSRISDSKEKGDMYGADLIYTKTRLSPYYVLAVSDVRMLTFPVSLILEGKGLSENSRYLIMKNLLILTSQSNMRKEHHRAILFQKGLRERIMTYLIQQRKRKKTNPFTISFSREQLANYLCVNRSALSHELSRMEQEGLISFHKNVFTLHRDMLD